MKLRLYWKYFLPLWLFPIPFYFAEHFAGGQIVLLGFPFVFLIASIPYFKKQLTTAETIGYSMLFMVPWVILVTLGAIVKQL